MTSLKKLKSATSLHDFAVVIGYKPQALSYILYKIPAEDKYTKFAIPKGNGGERTINAPEERLKHLQRRLADILNEYFKETCDASNRKKSLSHGFRPEHSIVTNAINHKNKRYVFNIDLKDFFPSINFGRVRGFFIKNNHFQLNPKVATIIAQIACHDNELPQGSPCSPVISNLIGHLLDIRMVGLAKKTKCTYSRYADDLTFSTNKKQFPEEIAVNIDENLWEPGSGLIKEIRKVGFEINERKTSMQYKTSRQLTTGLIVNKKINIKKEYYKKARSMCHELFMTDKFYIDKNNEVEGTLNQLEGKLSFIYHIKKLHDNQKENSRLYNPNAVTNLYRKFLFYKYFFALEKPLVICEGKTDILYLNCALKQLANDFNNLIEKKDGQFNFKVGIFPFSKNNKHVFAVSDCASGVGAIMQVYEQYMKSFKGSGRKHPVITLVDNDSGFQQIKDRFNKDKPIKKKLTEHDQSKPFLYLRENLYLVLIPSIEGKEVAIEDLFDKETLETKIEGKSFNRNAKIDPKTEYGKIVFAEKVIRANQDKINFEGFREIFKRFNGVIDDYKKYPNQPLNPKRNEPLPIPKGELEHARQKQSAGRPAKTEESETE